MSNPFGTNLEVFLDDDETNNNGSVTLDPGSYWYVPAGSHGSMGSAEHGTFGLFDASALAPVHVHSADYYGVVVSGTMTNPFNLESDPAELTRGGYWSVPAQSVHTTTCAEQESCLFYFHSRAGFDFDPVCADALD